MEKLIYYALRTHESLFIELEFSNYWWISLYILFESIWLSGQILVDGDVQFHQAKEKNIRMRMFKQIKEERTDLPSSVIRCFPLILPIDLIDRNRKSPFL